MTINIFTLGTVALIFTFSTLAIMIVPQANSRISVKGHKIIMIVFIASALFTISTRFTRDIIVNHGVVISEEEKQYKNGGKYIRHTSQLEIGNAHLLANWK